MNASSTVERCFRPRMNKLIVIGFTSSERKAAWCYVGTLREIKAGAVVLSNYYRFNCARLHVTLSKLLKAKRKKGKVEVPVHDPVYNVTAIDLDSTCAIGSGEAFF